MSRSALCIAVRTHQTSRLASEELALKVSSVWVLWFLLISDLSVFNGIFNYLFCLRCQAHFVLNGGVLVYDFFFLISHFSWGCPCSVSAARLHVGVLSPEHRLPVATMPKKNDSSSSSCHHLSVAFHLGWGLSHGLSRGSLSPLPIHQLVHSFCPSSACCPR